MRSFQMADVVLIIIFIILLYSVLYLYFLQKKLSKQAPVMARVIDSGSNETAYNDGPEYFMLLSYEANDVQWEEYLTTTDWTDVKKPGSEISLFVNDTGKILHIEIPSRNFHNRLFVKFVYMALTLIILFICHRHEIFPDK